MHRIDFGNHLNDILKDLEKHHKDKMSMLTECVQDRLTQSLSVYYKEINNSCIYLNRKEALKVAKKINEEF